MYLEHLTLQGFKSFANKTTLDFKPAYKQGCAGITAIVGPNGSGKSNVVDAMRWVLGEQSSKQLRGKKSGDVIFAGSDKKSQTSAARVSLRLNNEDKTVDLEYSEIELTRQLFRSGESDYLINEQRSRLQDIHYLLAQAHIGQRSYTVIGQGMIEQVLNSTPLERKEFFDEAAGIKHFQIKKDKAVQKLSTARENMQAAHLQLAEITPRLTSLTRQMKRLAEREEILSTLEQQLTLWYSSQWQAITVSLKQELDAKLQLEQQRNALQKTIAELHAQMESLAKSEDNHVFTELQNKQKELLYKKNEQIRERAEWQGRLDARWSQAGEHQLIVYQQQADALQRDIQNAKQELTSTYETIKATQKREQSLSQEYKQLLETITQLREKLFTHLDPNNDNAVQSLIALRTTLDSLVKQLEFELNQAKTTTVSVAELSQILSKLIAELKNNVNKLPNTTDQTSIVNWRNKLVENEETKTKLDAELLELKSQLKFLNQRIEALGKTINAKEQEHTKLASELNQAKTNTTPDKQQEDITKRLQELDENLASTEQALVDIEQQLQQKTNEEQEKKHSLYSIQQQATATQQELNDLGQRLTTYEIQLARLQSRQEELRHTSEQDFAKDWNELTKQWEQVTIPQDLDAQKLEQDIQQLKRKKELVGAIDEETKQEYAEIKERHDWLSSQTTDLEEAIGSLENIIADLDEKIDTQFSSNIKKINDKFSHYFGVLFNGGKAELKLTMTDEENEDEEETIEKNTRKSIAGIDIMATPPGKKLQNITVLSGGEKALTSIALICAIIANNNSPFVVLDEVDAALDEANSARFASILEELSTKTQFIVVTHNRATMEKAQLLYGVTMGDDGVSALLSIKLEQGQQYANR